MVMIVNMI